MTTDEINKLTTQRAQRENAKHAKPPHPEKTSGHKKYKNHKRVYGLHSLPRSANSQIFDLDEFALSGMPQKRQDDRR